MSNSMSSGGYSPWRFLPVRASTTAIVSWPEIRRVNAAYAPFAATSLTSLPRNGWVSATTGPRGLAHP
jgi:hypothetical protein